MSKWLWPVLFVVSILLGVLYLKFGGDKAATVATPSPAAAINDTPRQAPSDSGAGGPLSGDIVPQQSPPQQAPAQPSPAVPNFYQQPGFEQPNFEPPPPPPPPQNFPDQAEPFNPPPFDPGTADEDFQQNIPPPPPPPPPDEDF